MAEPTARYKLAEYTVTIMVPKSWTETEAGVACDELEALDLATTLEGAVTNLLHERVTAGAALTVHVSE
jgi:hypothetical protein